MTEYSKMNIVYRLQKWMDSVPGQTFLNYAYSWGAAVVILGTLFKLTHLPGANLMLYLGMGTEVVVFFLSAFDRPFDKTAIGKDLPTHLTEDEGEDADADAVPGVEDEMQPAVQTPGVIGGGTIIIGGASGQGPDTVPVAADGGIQAPASGVIGGGIFAGPAQMSADMEEATSNYVDGLKKVTEMLEKVSEQSERLTRDSEEMENLNRTLTGISRVYEMQLKSASTQIGTIDEINAQSRKLAEQIEQLNQIYARMIEAMTVNMPGGVK